MAQRYCKVCSGWHDLAEPWPFACYPVRDVARSDMPTPMVISDTMDPTKSMADGKVYTSKSGIRATYKPSGNPNGYSYAEVGNDYEGKPLSRPDPKPDVSGIDDSILKALARYDNGERA